LVLSGKKGNIPRDDFIKSNHLGYVKRFGKKDYIVILIDFIKVIIYSEKLNKNQYMKRFRFIIITTLRHEAGHLWDRLVNSERIHTERARKRLELSLLKRQLGSLKKGYPQSLNKPIARIRKELFSFIVKLQREGLADFFRKRIHRKLPLKQVLFLKLYRKAITSANSYRVKFYYDLKELYESGNVMEMPNNLNKIADDIKGHKTAYTIGLHMFYTLYALGNLDVEQIANLSYLQFVNKYEEVITVVGKPVVSIKSKAGIIDYYSLLYQWNRIAKQFK